SLLQYALDRPAARPTPDTAPSCPIRRAILFARFRLARHRTKLPLQTPSQTHRRNKSVLSSQPPLYLANLQLRLALNGNLGVCSERQLFPPKPPLQPPPAHCKLLFEVVNVKNANFLGHHFGRCHLRSALHGKRLFGL